MTSEVQMKNKIWIIIGIVGIILLTSGGVLLLTSNHKDKEPDLPVIEQKPGDEKPPVEEKHPVEEIKEEPISLELAEELYHMVYDKDWCGFVFESYYQYNLTTADSITNKDKNRIVILNLIKKRKESLVSEEYRNNRVFTLDEILNNNKLFVELKKYKQKLEGKCSKCSYKMICGGCRASAVALKNSLFEEDPLCLLKSS